MPEHEIVPPTQRELPTGSRRLRVVDAIVPAAIFLRALLPWTGAADLPFDTRAAATWFSLGALWVVCVGMPAAFARERWTRAAGHLQVALVAAILLASRIPHGTVLDPAALGVIAIILAFVYGLGPRRPSFQATPFLARWSPLLFSAFAYVSLASILPARPEATADAWLSGLDAAIGTPLTHAFARIEHPLLTEWFALHYAAYLGYPILVAALLDLRGRADVFDLHVTAFAVAMFTGFACYLLVPAAGPWVGDAAAFATPFPRGYFVGPMLEGMVRRYAYPFDGFPSLHMANSLLAVYFVRFASRRVFAVLAFCQVNLVLATVYLRMHYTVDLLAGLALAIAVALLVTSLRSGDCPRGRFRCTASSPRCT